MELKFESTGYHAKQNTERSDQNHVFINNDFNYW